MTDDAHYGEHGWTIHEFDLKILIPLTGSREDALSLIREALDEAAWDIQAFEMREDERVEPQGEPSDAQVDAAADAIRWASERGGWVDMARAALRAAGEVNPLSERSLSDTLSEFRNTNT